MFSALCLCVCVCVLSKCMCPCLTAKERVGTESLLPILSACPLNTEAYTHRQKLLWLTLFRANKDLILVKVVFVCLCLCIPSCEYCFIKATAKRGLVVCKSGEREKQNLRAASFQFIRHCSYDPWANTVGFKCVLIQSHRCNWIATQTQSEQKVRFWIFLFCAILIFSFD